MENSGAVDAAMIGLRTLIAGGALKPGDKLPPESELAERLSVSRGSVREASRTLAALGVIETRRGAGSFVGQLTAAGTIRALTLTVGLLPLDAILELYELRRVLESHAASLAAARRDDETLASLETLLTEIESTTDDEKQSELDNDFHARVAALAGNEALGALISVLRSRSRAYHLFSTDDGATIKAESDRGHRAMLAALRDRDPGAAAAATAAHVARTEHWLRTHRPPPEDTL